MTIAIIDYGAGNLYSVFNALRYIGERADIILAKTGNDLARASHIILPGVGSFATCMQGLQALSGMIDALEQKVLYDNTPFLGICVGMQMLFEYSEENGVYTGLGWLEGAVKPLHDNMPDTKCNAKISAADKLRIPHMGWNELNIVKNNALFADLKNGEHVYFVHSYHCLPADNDIVTATVEYGVNVVAAINKANIMAVQFHPEKSYKAGLQLLSNFLNVKPTS